MLSCKKLNYKVATIVLFMTTAVLLATPGMAADTGTTYKIDPLHSIALFDIEHLGVSRFVGRFDSVNGSFVVKPSGSTVSVTIPLSSLDTNHEPRDKHLKSPDFFNAAQFPDIKFEGKQEGDELKGDLTMHGVTKPVTFHFKKIGEGKDPFGGYRVGYEATTVIKRSDFGMKFMIPALSDDVDLRVDLEGMRQ